MPLSDTQIDGMMQIIRQTAAEEIVPRFRNLGEGEVDTKAHAADLVTIADKRAEEVMTERFGALLPGDAVIGEEAISAGTASLEAVGHGRCVVIDPIDGTWNFAHGLANYGVLVAVVEETTSSRVMRRSPPSTWRKRDQRSLSLAFKRESLQASRNS